MNNDQCVKCGSNKLIKDAEITDFGHGNVKNDLAVYIQKTDRIAFNKFTKGSLRAQICGSCGDVQLRIDNSQELWETYQKFK